LSLDSIAKITEAEAAAARMKSDATADARRTVELAEENGKAALEKALSDAEKETLQLRRELEKKAATDAEELNSKTLSHCAAVRAHAEARLDKAAAIVVDRIVKGFINSERTNG
jgi:V/A-type H+-transporting ATPase subunit G/H